MLLRAMQEDDEPPKQRPYRAFKFPVPVVPLRDGIKAANGGTIPDNVVPIANLKPLQRVDFKNQLDYEIYRELRRMDKEAEEARVQAFRDLKDAALVEVPESDPPSEEPVVVPLAGSDAAVLDDRVRLNNYLAHCTPLGKTEFIKTVPNSVMIEGQPYNAPKRQDAIVSHPEEKRTYCRLYKPRFICSQEYNERGEKTIRRILRHRDGSPRIQSVHEDYLVATHKGYSEFNEYAFDGKVFLLSGDLESDRARALRRTRLSQKKRKKLGKAQRTTTLNAVMIGEYRPVPDNVYFLKHPAGHGAIHESAWPHGVVDIEDTGSRLAHEKRGADWVNTQKYFAQYAARELQNGTPKSDIVRAMMQMYGDTYEYWALWHNRERSKRDDIPWDYEDESYDRPDPSAFQPSEGPIIETPNEQRQDNPTTVAQQLPQPRLAREEQIGTRLQHISKDGFDWKWPNRSKNEETEAEDQSAPEEAIVYVAADGLAMPWRGTASAREPVLKWLAGNKDHRLKRQDPLPTPEDLKDPRYIPLINAQIQQVRERMHEDAEHLSNLIASKFVLEARAGINHEYIVELPFEDAANDEVSESVRVLTLEDLGIKPPRRKGIPRPAFRKFIQTCDSYGREWQPKATARTEFERMKRRRRDSLGYQSLLRAKRFAKTNTVPAEVNALRRMKLRRESRLLLKQHELRQQLEALSKARKHTATERVQELGFYKRMAKLRIPNWRRFLRIRALRLKLRKKRRELQFLANFKEPRLEPIAPSNTVVPLPNRAPPEVREHNEPKGLVLLPEEKVVVFDDHVITAQRAAFMQKLMGSGKFTPEELRAANEVFRPRVQHRMQEHREDRERLTG